MYSISNLNRSGNLYFTLKLTENSMGPYRINSFVGFHRLKDLGKMDYYSRKDLEKKCFTGTLVFTKITKSKTW